MSIYSDVADGLIQAATSALSEFTDPLVILSHQNGAESSQTYCVINILNIQQQGHHSTSSQTRANFELNIRVVYEVMAQFSFIGSQSGDMAQSFTQRLNNNPIMLQTLKKNNLGFMRKSQIRRAPQKRDTQWVEYHNIDATFNYIVNTTEVSDYVESIIVDSEQTGVFTVPEGIIIP
jgi:hypothetical protein